MENQILSTKAVKDIENKICYTFNNKVLLQQAFICGNYTNENVGHFNNQVLEFVGDRVLSFIITKELIKYNAKIDNNFELATIFDEGDFTNQRVILEEGANLTDCIEKLGISKYLLVGNGDNTTDNIFEEDLFEALIASVALDCDYNIDVLTKVVYKMLNLEQKVIMDTNKKIKRLTKKDIGVYNIDTAYNRLQELYKKRFIKAPIYNYVNFYDRNGQENWTCDCSVLGYQKTTVTEKKKSLARLKASKLMLDKISSYIRF